MRIVLPIACFALFSQFAFAQTKPVPLDAAAAKGVVDHLIQGLDDYIFPDRAATIKVYLQQHMGEYTQIHAPEDLAKRLTADLQAQGQDKHLQVGYEAPNAGEPTLSEDTPQRIHQIEEVSAFGFRDVLRLPGNVGYLKVKYFSADSEAASYLAGAMTLLQGTDALILDLRENEGGSPNVVDQLESYFFDDQVQLTSILWREGGKMREQQQWTSLVAGPKFLNKPVYVLTSSKTFSAAEQCSYDLKVLKRATLVGETTGGGANPASMPHPLGDHFGAFIPNGKANNPVTKTNWEGVGVVPEMAVPAADALITAYVQALEKSKPQVPDPDLDQARKALLQNPKQSLHDAGFTGGM